jgi:hypothetical protein
MVVHYLCESGLSNVSTQCIRDATTAQRVSIKIPLLLREIQPGAMLNPEECQLEVLTDRQSANG